MTSIQTLAEYLVKHHFMNLQNAMIIVEDEWEYIEDMMLRDDVSMETMAQELLEIYMVA